MDREHFSIGRAIIAWIIVLLTGLASWQLTMIFLRLDLTLRWWNLGLALGVIHILMSRALVDALMVVPIPPGWIH